MRPPLSSVPCILWGVGTAVGAWETFSSPPPIPFLSPSDSQADDMDMDLDKEFLQELKELKVLVADKDLLDLHKRCPRGPGG